MIGLILGVVYYESLKRELKTKPINECRCDERLQTTSNVVYYKSLKRELKTKPIKECRCDERLQTRVEESTRHYLCVYLQQNKKKSKSENKNCHTKTMLSLKKPIKLI